MNIISNDGSNKLNRSRKARVSYKVQRTINASLSSATSTRAVSSNPNFVTRQKIEIIFYYLSLHDALPICCEEQAVAHSRSDVEQPHGARLERFLGNLARAGAGARGKGHDRSEEHTSELQSHREIVCRLLLEKKRQKPE